MNNSRGQMLIELIIVLSGLLIFASLSVRTILQTPKFELMFAIKWLQAEILKCQQEALCFNAKITIKFIEQENRMVFFQRETTFTKNLPKNIIFGVIPGIKGPPGKPKNTINQPIKFENPHPLAAIIQSNGRISSGTIYLKHIKKDLMGALTILPHQIGHVKTYLCNHEQWVELESVWSSEQ